MPPIFVNLKAKQTTSNRCQVLTNLDTPAHLVPALTLSSLVPCLSGLNANSKCHWPVGPVTPRIYRSCKSFTGHTNFPLTFNKKNQSIKFTDNSYLYLSIFIHFKNHFGTFLRRNLLTRMSPNVYWPCRTSWGDFYWSGANGSLLGSSPACSDKNSLTILVIFLSKYFWEK